jgi:hypothetical protein
MRIKKNGHIIRLTESDLKRILKRVVSEDSGQNQIMDKAMSGDFLRSITDTQELFNKISNLQSALTYKNFLNWDGKKTDSRLWGVCEEDGTGCGACARTLKKGGKTNENGECMEDVINFVRQKGDIKELFNKLS